MAVNVKRSAGFVAGGVQFRRTRSVQSLNPSGVSGLVAWYKADSLALSNGATVTLWPDDSPNNNDLNSYGGSPIYNASDPLLNGMPSVTYDGSDWNYRSNPTGLPVGSAAHTTYVVGYWDGTSGNHLMFAWGANAYVGCRLGVGIGTLGIIFESLNMGSKPRTITANNSFILSFPYVAGADYSASTTYLDGVGESGEYPGFPGVPNIINPVTEIAIGYPPTAGGERWTGAVAEVLVFNTTHDASTREGIEKYLSDKYGVTVVSSVTSGRLSAKIPPPPTPAIPIVTTNLILYLDAGNATSYPGSGTTWYDLSGNGNNASAVGTPTYTVTNGGGFNFNSVSDYFDTTPNLREAYTSNGLTAAAWVKATSFPYVSAIIARGDWSFSSGWALHEHFNNTIMGPRYTQAQSNNSAVTTDVVYYVAFTIDTSGNAKVYINGVQNGSTSTGVTVPTASGVSPVIGNFQGNSYNWDGDIYQIHVYDRALTSGEMLSNFNATKSRYGL